MLARFTARHRPPARAGRAVGVRAVGAADRRRRASSSRSSTSCARPTRRVSVAQTYLHYLPCGDQRGAARPSRRATARPCTSAGSRSRPTSTRWSAPTTTRCFDQAAASGALHRERARRARTCSTYSTDARAFQVGSSTSPRRRARRVYASVARRGDRRRPRRLDGGLRRVHAARLADRATASPGPSQPQPLSAPTTTAPRADASPRRGAADRPLPALGLDRRRAAARRSSGAATRRRPGASTGSRSAVRQALTMGLSGISTWGSDIGGFFALFDDELTPELLTRWVQFGAVSGVMRTQPDGIALPDEAAAAGLGRRPDRQLAALREAPHPALPVPRRGRRRVPAHRAAAHAPPRAGVPRTTRRPPGATTSSCSAPTCSPRRCSSPGRPSGSLYLPRGRWVDLWRSARYRDGDGALRLGGRRCSAGAGDDDRAGAARRAAAPRPRRGDPAAAAGRRRHAQRLPGDVDDRRSPSARTGCPARVPARQELGAGCSTASGSARASAAGDGCCGSRASARRKYRLQASLKTLKTAVQRRAR